MRIVFRIAGLWALLAAGCSLPEREGPPVADEKDHSYRALGNYCWDEIARMRKSPFQITKTIRLNGETVSAPVQDSAGLEALFRPLMDADISRPSLADAYVTDTIPNHFTGDTTFIHRSRGKQTWPAQLIVEIDSSRRIRNVQASSYTQNPVYEYRQEIAYERDRQLTVTSMQKIVFMKAENMEITAIFRPLTAQQP
ncbi:hypothetical protein WJU16_14655 [Chitinophaga pollutisoli]|uniref:LPS export ABC transporter periplasmic protein LptC n=1 Tax=Chitinophaga pollutisoli TaxID=3133966 RepID=A0ABZ2YIE2_9BACT